MIKILDSERVSMRHEFIFNLVYFLLKPSLNKDTNHIVIINLFGNNSLGKQQDLFVYLRSGYHVGKVLINSIKKHVRIVSIHIHMHTDFLADIVLSGAYLFYLFYDVFKSEKECMGQGITKVVFDFKEILSVTFFKI
jgi:hypothetical protein